MTTLPHSNAFATIRPRSSLRRAALWLWRNRTGLTVLILSAVMLALAFSAPAWTRPVARWIVEVMR